MCSTSSGASCPQSRRLCIRSEWAKTCSTPELADGQLGLAGKLALAVLPVLPVLPRVLELVEQDVEVAFAALFAGEGLIEAVDRACLAVLHPGLGGVPVRGADDRLARRIELLRSTPAHDFLRSEIHRDAALAAGARNRDFLAVHVLRLPAWHGSRKSGSRQRDPRPIGDPRRPGGKSGTRQTWTRVSAETK